MIKRTQLRRSVYHILGEKQGDNEEEEKSSDPSLQRDAHLRDYNDDIFDDDDFYHQVTICTHHWFKEHIVLLLNCCCCYFILVWDRWDFVGLSYLSYMGQKKCYTVGIHRVLLHVEWDRGTKGFIGKLRCVQFLINFLSSPLFCMTLCSY